MEAIAISETNPMEEAEKAVSRRGEQRQIRSVYVARRKAAYLQEKADENGAK